MGVLTVLLVLGSMFVALCGLFLSTQDTLGVGLLATACLIGILARLAQAADLHNQIKARLDRIIYMEETRR